MEQDEPSHPVDVTGFSANAVAADTDAITHLNEQFGRFGPDFHPHDFRFAYNH